MLIQVNELHQTKITQMTHGAVGSLSLHDQLDKAHLLTPEKGSHSFLSVTVSNEEVGGFSFARRKKGRKESSRGSVPANNLIKQTFSSPIS